MTSTPIATPPIDSWLSTTVSAFTNTIGNFFTNDWPALVILILGLVLVMVIFHFGMTGVRRLIRFGRN